MWAPDKCEPRARRPVGTGDIRRAPYVVRDAIHLPATKPNYADPTARASAAPQNLGKPTIEAPRIRLTIRQRMRVSDEWPRQDTFL
jgi:hypothetical protein